MSNPFVFSDTGSGSSVLTSFLANNINENQTDIELTDASNFPSKGKIQIASEIIFFTGKSSNTLTGCFRGTSPTSHLSETLVTLLPRQSDNPISQERQYTGWYKERGSNSITLRLSDSNLMMKGAVRFNKDTSTFQGFNGTEWVTFNAEKGDTGEAGASASDIFNFINLPEDSVNDGEIFKNKTSTDIYFRTIQAGTFDINEGLTGLSSLDINKGNDFLTLTPQPQPYIWDFSTPQRNNLEHLKSNNSNTVFKAFGKIEKWQVKSGSSVQKGKAVRITIDIGLNPSSTFLVIEPYTYSTNIIPLNHKGYSFLGIALENSGAGQTCLVCTEGITSVIIGDQTDGTQADLNIQGVGAVGIIGTDGTIFNTADPITTTMDSPIAGYWLEENNFTTGDIVLFYVKPSRV